MKYITIIMIALFAFSCKKESNPEKRNSTNQRNDTSYSCNCNFDTFINPNFSSVISDSLLNSYLDIWKSILKEKSNMPESYFNQHIKIKGFGTGRWDAGISFGVGYIVEIDWVKIKCYDQFIIKLDSAYGAYYGYGIPRNAFLNRDMIKSNSDRNILTEIRSFQLLDSIPYEDCEALCEAIHEKTGLDYVNMESVSYYVPGKSPRENGYPYVLLNGSSDNESPGCITGYFNIAIDNFSTWKTECIIR